MKIKSVDGLLLYKFTQPVSRPVEDDLFVLVGDYKYTMQLQIGGKFHSFEAFIPDGFLHDKRSLKFRFVRLIRTRDGLCEIAALLHDAMYRTAGGTKNLDLGTIFIIDGERATFTRRACDQIYKYVYDSVRPSNSEPERDYFWLRLGGASEFGQRTPPAMRSK
jgi:hypothetical protein